MAGIFQSNLTLRVLTGLIGGPIILALILISWWTTALLIILVMILAAVEYVHIVQQEPSSPRNNFIFGVLYLGIPLVAALWLRAYEDGHLWYLLLLASNWTTDSAAYFSGRFWGKTLFAPKISPKKTWEGVVGGVIGGFLVPVLLAEVLDMKIGLAVISLALFVPVATVLGDLLESKLKRRFHVKDSGHILPGHGGILDRIDGTLLALPVAALMVALFT